MAARSRVLLLRSLAGAIRSATRPGAPSMGDRLGSLPRLVRAVVSGRYREITTGRLALLAAGLAYVVSPVDLIPEGLLLAFGLVDDALVLSWLAANLVTETESFLAWEKRGAPAPGATAFDAAGYGDTVPGVVHNPGA